MCGLLLSITFDQSYAQVWPSSQQTSLSGRRHRVQTLQQEPRPTGSFFSSSQIPGGPCARTLWEGLPTELQLSWTIHLQDGSIPYILQISKSLCSKNMTVMKFCNKRNGGGGRAESVCFAGSRGCDLAFHFLI